MASTNYIGQRLSFGSALCTVRYIGSVTGTQKEWLGVEWDDPTRGKHDGEHQGRRYFNCRCKIITAASFIRPSRTSDPPVSFIDAVHQKYATETTERQDAVAAMEGIEIGGKLAQEVGFDKIRQQLRQLTELKIVLVDGVRINSAGPVPEKIKEVCPKIVELDLSRNLIDDLNEIIGICSQLSDLKILQLNGNRIDIHPTDAIDGSSFDLVKELGLDDTLLTWEEVRHFASLFPSLRTLTACSNQWQSIPAFVQPTSDLSSLTSLKLEYNGFSSLHDVSPLSGLQSLAELFLKGNRISSVSDAEDTTTRFGSQLRHVDLSYNQVSNWDFVDSLPDVFPGLVSLRFSHNPIYAPTPVLGGTAVSVDETYMLTLARLANLKALNFSTITPAERTNAEMFYLSRIGKAMAAVPKDEEHKIAFQHRRYAELCETYGEPDVMRADTSINPNFLESRLIKFHFHEDSRSDRGIKKTVELPKGFDVYQIKGIVGKLFGIEKPLSIMLVWETGEFDPVAGFEEYDSEDEERSTEQSKEEMGRGKWMRREVELEDGTRQIGFCVDGLEANVRVEYK